MWRSHASFGRAFAVASDSCRNQGVSTGIGGRRTPFRWMEDLLLVTTPLAHLIPRIPRYYWDSASECTAGRARRQRITISPPQALLASSPLFALYTVGRQWHNPERCASCCKR
ncbi:hypothetical protein BDN71DRAFT_137502 [Pleurotus eryngii]|uniref:Uncharacterized protein n=1 Tax=Pleurotus eryngii TaxID=5323 RepID=A0A9P6D4M4_PLEER|nr:hypothetical protein BDN71DRAFT_137502 [Pleurotus eryngii]